ncbi:hypothetical protein [Undibacterium sp. TJN19]|uniref:hypothetical protein n=1 Tax=Undibacterium sp. TJN19 TaxID=3413055 RepID=UPI003BF0BFBE
MAETADCGTGAPLPDSSPAGIVRAEISGISGLAMGKRINQIISVSYLAVLIVAALSGCGVHVRAPNTPDQGNAEITRVSGKNEKGAALITHVNGQQVGFEMTGYATGATTPPGPSKLIILCRLDKSAMSGRQRPFDEVDNGVGVVVGSSGSAIAQIRLNADLKPNTKYELHCEPTGDYRARAWLVELH